MANVLNLKPTEPESEANVAAPVVDDAFGPEEVQWEAQNPLPSHARSRRYAFMGMLAVIGAGVAWWQASALTFVVIFLGLATWEVRERFARPVAARADERGVTIDGTLYPATRLSSFDIHRMPDGTHELSIATTAWHAQRLRLPLGDQDPEQIRAVLARIAPEEEHAVPLLDWWLRK
jgi:hypothetical protein